MDDNARLAKNRKRTLLRRGYKVKHTSIGYWVDGMYGYAVSSYYDTEDAAVSAALSSIKDAKQNGRRPAWLI